MQGTFAWLPFWFGELHLAVTIASVVLVAAGGIDTLVAAGALDTLRSRFGR